MKKFTKILALTLVLIMSVAMFASCAAVPNKDPQKAKEALEKNEYKVVFADGEEAEFAGSLLGAEKVTAIISASKGDDAIEILYFEDDAAADAAFETIETKAKNAGTTAEVRKSGSMIYYGTSAALKAAK